MKDIIFAIVSVLASLAFLAALIGSLHFYGWITKGFPSSPFCEKCGKRTRHLSVRQSIKCWWAKSFPESREEDAYFCFSSPSRVSQEAYDRFQKKYHYHRGVNEIHK